ncbi:helix-turn-helix transcriptional regulator [Photobacterium satsumensis]|uniref:helix-turn-helix transcriptional regulator n=1 Tax=Photobacterium satsumensis TaxID=2910239 RepID=UPI003D118BDC
MCQRVIANTPKFLMFDLQKVSETKHMIFGADYILVAPRTAGCTLHLASTQYRLKVGQLVLLAPFNPFRLSLFSSGGQRKADCDVLHFRLNALGQTFVDSIQFQAIKQMLDDSRSGLLFDDPQGDAIQQYIEPMVNTFDFIQVLNLLGLLNHLSVKKPLCCLINNCVEISNSKRAEDRVHTALKYIDQHLGESISVAKVADQLHMADSTFSRFFHANMGITFRQYLIEQRVRQAARYLVTTDWSIAHIGTEVGFSSLSNFNAKFKGLLKVTPREYRAKHIDMREGIDTSRSIAGQVTKQFYGNAS